MRGTEGTQAVASAVRAEMARMGLKQVDLADILQVSQAGISRKLHGEIPFSVADLYDIADALELNVVDLLPLEPARRMPSGLRRRRRERQPAGWGWLPLGQRDPVPV